MTRRKKRDTTYSLDLLGAVAALKAPADGKGPIQPLFTTENRQRWLDWAWPRAKFPAAPATDWAAGEARAAIQAAYDVKYVFLPGEAPPLAYSMPTKASGALPVHDLGHADGHAAKAEEGWVVVFRRRAARLVHGLAEFIRYGGGAESVGVALDTEAARLDALLLEVLADPCMACARPLFLRADRTLRDGTVLDEEIGPFEGGGEDVDDGPAALLVASGDLGHQGGDQAVQSLGDRAVRGPSVLGDQVENVGQHRLHGVEPHHGIGFHADTRALGRGFHRIISWWRTAILNRVRGGDQ